MRMNQTPSIDPYAVAVRPGPYVRWTVPEGHRAVCPRELDA
ncbi:hypothetical protein RKE29_12610 [Streptomyces sp. B1866]|nr:hypothetical protein [Streptomyces sp. B1866]MDT3397481.1 hypothetical protein [Streptomyces sp. B1866]